MCKRLVLIGLLMACAGSVAFGNTVAYWRFDDFGISDVDTPAGTVASGNPLPDSDGRTVWRIAAYDHSGNGNHLTSWEYDWAGLRWSDEVPTSLINALGLDNSVSGQTAGDYPAMMTWSAQSHPAGVDLETWSPVTWTIEASFKVNNVDGYNTIVGRDGRDVCTSNLDGNAEPALAPFYLSIRQGDGSMGVLFTDVSGYLHFAQSDPGAIEVGKWYNVAAVCDGTSLSLYINNVLITTTDMTLTGSPDTAMAIGNGSGGDWSPGTWSVTRGLYNGGHVDRVSGWVDEIRFSDTALTPSEFLYGKPSAKATSPVPLNNSSDVYRDVMLQWRLGTFDALHTLFFGDDSDAALNSTTPLASALTETSYDLGRLDLGKTYFWRVDEVNVTPDKTVTQGNVWNFTVEPLSYVVAGAFITASASSSAEGWDPNTTINGAGLNAANEHSTEDFTMWRSLPADLEPSIQFNFAKTLVLDKVLVWNSNLVAESAIGWGAKDIIMETSVDGVEWTVVPGASQLSRAPGSVYGTPDTVDLHGVVAQHVRIKVLSTWGGLPVGAGLSEVQFYQIPAYARNPVPADGAVNIDPATDLVWRPGRQSSESTVYLSTDEAAVTNGTAPATATQAISLDLADLGAELDQTYYWRVDDANDVEVIPVWQGNVWSFSTLNHVTVDDFESYTNDSPNKIFQTWIDGYGYSTPEPGKPGNGTGSALGHDNWTPSSPYYGLDFMETVIVKGGKQSTPFYYDNSVYGVSQIDRTWTTPQNWGGNGIQTLVMYFHGARDNTGGTLYAKINGKKVTYSDNGALSRNMWTQWNIDLTSLGTNLSNVSSLSIGVEGSGSGLVYIDDLLLYRDAPAVVTGVDPGTAGLAAKYSLDNNLDDTSGKGLGSGTVTGYPVYIDGLAGNGMALSFNGEDDFVELPIGGVIASANSMTIACWADFSNQGGAWQRVWDFGSGDNANPYMFFCPRVNTAGPTRLAIRSKTVAESIVEGPGTLASGWQHVTAVFDGTAKTMTLYINGSVVAQGPTAVIPSDLGNTFQNYLGKSQWPDALYKGSIDDVLIYTRVLSAGEVRYLAGDQ